MVELVNPGISSLVQLKDGSLLSNNGRISRDKGLTWSKPKPLSNHINGDGLVSLQSGAIALTDISNNVCFSYDDGNTWTTPLNVLGHGAEIISKITIVDSLYDEMIQLNSGRLIRILCMNFTSNHPELKYEDVIAYGNYKGQRYDIEGHGHLPEFYLVFTVYSDDEGKTWNISKGPCGAGHLMGWFDEEGLPNGRSGLTAFGETTAAETSDGRVLLFSRSQVNRVVHSYSCDSGETWSAVLPTGLANSQSPPRLRRIPSTGDLICVWNQVSRSEVQRGYRRGRLSAAISKDNGSTWQNFKTLEQCAGMDDIECILPEYPIREVRSREYVGQLPEGFNYYHYPNICFAYDKVYIMYTRSDHLQGIAEQNLYKQENVLRIYPLEWFYK